MIAFIAWNTINTTIYYILHDSGLYLGLKLLAGGGGTFSDFDSEDFGSLLFSVVLVSDFESAFDDESLFESAFELSLFPFPFVDLPILMLL